MCYIRSEKIKRIADVIPNQKIFGMDDADLLVVGWGELMVPCILVLII